MSNRDIIESHTVRQLFGTDARITGRTASLTEPGEARIVMNGEIIGSGPSFSEAVRCAIRSRHVPHLPTVHDIPNLW